MSEKAIEDFIEGEAQVAEKVVQDLSGNPHAPSKWICSFKLYEFWVSCPHLNKEASMSHALKPPPRKQEDAVIVISLLTLAFIGFIT